MKKVILCLTIVFGLAQGILADSLDEWAQKEGLELWFDPALSVVTIKGNIGNITIPYGYEFGILGGTDKFQIPELTWSDAGLTIGDKGKSFLKDLVNAPPEDGASAKKVAVIFLDAGHGGKDPGSIGTFVVNGKKVELREKDVTLAVTLKLQKLLKAKFPQIKILTTRNTDEYLSLEERTNKANGFAKSRQETVLFISIHANANLSPKASGHEVWYLPPETRRNLLKKDEFNVDKSVSTIINNLIEEELTVESYLLAQTIHKALTTKLSGLSEPRGIKQEEWYVVRKAFMPSILVEVGFVTNREEFDLMRTDDYLQKLASGIYSGIVSFVEDYENGHK